MQISILDKKRGQIMKDKNKELVLEQTKLAIKYGKDKWNNASGTHWIVFDGHCYKISFWRNLKTRDCAIQGVGDEKPERKSFFKNAKNFVLDNFFDRPEQGFDITVDSNPEIRYTGKQGLVMDLYRVKYLLRNRNIPR